MNIISSISRLCKVALLIGGLTICSNAQRSDTIYQVLVTNSNVASQPTVNVTNIGQSYHQFVVSFQNNGGTCTNPLFTGQPEFSYDNSTWIPFGNPQGGTSSTSNSTSPVLYVGGGAYPYVRFNVFTFTVGCGYTIDYSGTLASSATITQGQVVIQNSVLNKSANGYTFYPLLSGGVADKNLVSPTTVCNNQLVAAAPVSSGNYYATAIASGIPLGPNNQGKYAICQITASSASTATIQFGTSTDTCTTISYFSPVYNLSAGVPMSIGDGAGVVIFGKFSSSSAALCATVTGATVNFSLQGATQTYLGQ